MMQAAERPWMIRPAIRKNAVPTGEMAISSEPRTLKARPALVSFTRPKAVCQSARHDDKDSREQRGDADRDVAHALADSEISAHRWRDIERGLGEEPEGHDGEDNADDQGVIGASRAVPQRGVAAIHFARYANAAITSAWVPVDSVGSMTGAKNSE